MQINSLGRPAPWLLHPLRSAHWLMGCTVLLRQTLQHWAGPTGTTCPMGDSLQPWPKAA